MSHCLIMTSRKRILKTLGNGPTRRNLFGPVDREQLQLEYRDTLQKDLEDASRRWGFNFFTEKPLDGGDFEWEGVPGAKVPALYRSCMVVDSPRGRMAAAAMSPAPAKAAPSPSPDGKENISCGPDWCGNVPRNVEKTPQKKNKLKRKQTNITDFYKAKRRLVATPRKTGQ